VSRLDAKHKTFQPSPTVPLQRRNTELHSYTGRTSSGGPNSRKSQARHQENITNRKDSQGVELDCLGGCGFHH